MGARTDRIAGTDEEEIRNYRAIGIETDKLEPSGRVQEEVITLNPELLKKGGDYSEKPEVVYPPGPI